MAILILNEDSTLFS